MLGNLNGWHLVIILVVILLLFGATRLPALSKSLGQSMRIFRSETKAMKEENGETPVAPVATETVPPAAAAPAPPAAAAPAPPVAPAPAPAVAPESTTSEHPKP
ncbi:Sec-independent protein translocase subunit TatA [Herbiconiux sp.]|uniref:Sec-independent protein translocase subunit TatA n=1 Tax=Herbiconiux sp. TaxID=1871186 RepID=UPI0025C39F93|nr:Sec-independent protein translocase subunit TatA [Herbiconiux sp.]